MSADRLRQAADRLDGQWSDNTDWVLEATTWDEGAQGWVVTGHATHEVAALLRNLAYYWADPGIAESIRDDAMNLANAVLGGTDA